MSARQPRKRSVEARRDGRVVGSYGEPKHLNPYSQNSDRYGPWNVGWEAGHRAHLRMKTRKVRAM